MALAMALALVMALAGMYFCFLLCSKFLIYQEKLVLPLAMHIQ
jgi:hypothetical protein